MVRKQKTIHYLYKTTCIITGRYYIGMHSTCNLEDGYMGSGKRLRYSIRKHGIENHKKEILEFFESRDLLVEAEKVVITPEMLTNNDCMNIMSGGTGGFISVEQQRFRSECAGKARVKRYQNDEEYAKKVRELASKIMFNNHKNGKIKYDTFKGKKHSDETKKLMSEIRSKQSIGKGNSQYGTCWIMKDGLNKKIKKEDLETFIKEGWIKGRN
jgi:hypothetical protein